MASPRETISDVAAVLGIGVFCIPLLLQLLPLLELSRNEARVAKAFGDVRRLRDSSQAPAADTALKEQDPWGKPYRVVSLRNGEFRVLSDGPNQSSVIGATDFDDIYSDMPTNPVKENIRRKNVKFLVAIGVTGGAWFLLAALYLRFRPRCT